MEDLKVLDEREVLGKEFKMYGTKENPLFLAKDVANWIEHTHTTRMLERVDEDEKLNGIIVHAGQKKGNDVFNRRWII
jgi:prophage antirepressor-like protein